MPHLPADIVQIPLFTPFDMGPANVWLVTGEVPTLIDMGIDWNDSFPRLEAGIRGAGLALTDIAQILCTHGHEDHVGLAAAFMERHEVPLYLHEADHLKLTDNQPGPPWMRWPHEMLALYERSGVPEDVVAPMRGPEVGSFQTAMGIGFRRYAHPRPLHDGQTFRAGDRTLTVVGTPGHAPGQVCFLDEQAGFLFAGDQVLDKVSPNPIVEFHGGERYLALVHYVRSLHRVADLDVHCTCAGHGPPIWDTDRVIREYFEVFDLRREMARKLVRRGMQTAFAVTRHLYKHAEDWALLPAFNAGLGYLDVLEDEGSVVQHPGEDGVLYWRAVEDRA